MTSTCCLSSANSQVCGCDGVAGFEPFDSQGGRNVEEDPAAQNPISEMLNTQMGRPTGAHRLDGIQPVVEATPICHVAERIEMGCPMAMRLEGQRVADKGLSHAAFGCVVKTCHEMRCAGSAVGCRTGRLNGHREAHCFPGANQS